jgi:hypothetical protein
MSTPGTYIASAQPLARFIGECTPCDRPVSTSVELTFTGDHYQSRCPDCRKWLDLQRLYGTVSKMVCDGRCMSAHRNICDCACGGINHGDVWSKPGEMLADELAAYRRDRDRRVAAAAKARKTREERKAALRREAFEAWAADHADLIAELAGTDWLTCEYPNEALASMANTVGRGEVLADWQTEKAERMLARRREVRERIAAEQAARAERTASLTEVPESRQIITGTIVAAWTFDGDFGMIWKIKVDCGQFHVRGTLPRQLESEALPQPYNGDDWQNLKNTLPGRRLTMRATLKPDGRERGQGYFSRPSNGAWITEAEPATA